MRKRPRRKEARWLEGEYVEPNHSDSSFARRGRVRRHAWRSYWYGLPRSQRTKLKRRAMRRREWTTA